MKRAPRPRVVETLARADRPERWTAAAPARARRLGAELARALTRNELVLRYQPIVDLRSGECRRVEALLRWRRRGASVAPAELIAVAQDTGQIGALSRWVIAEAVRQWIAWRERGLVLGIAVNVAGPELADPGVVGDTVKTLGALHIQPGVFTFDISPAALLTVPDVRGALSRLAAAGARFALDGVSPADMPGRTFARGIDELKLSRSLVRRLTTEPAALHDARALVEIAHDLSLSVVAVGVEDAATRDLVAKLGCEFAQGHWVSRPLAARSVAPWQRLAVGLAFGGALALATHMGATRAAGSGAGSASAPRQLTGFLPTICSLDLPLARARTSEASAVEQISERAGRDMVAVRAARADLFVEATVTGTDRTRIARAVDRDAEQLERDYGRSFARRPAVYVFATRISFATGLQRLFGARATDAGLLAAANGGVTLPRYGAVAINLENVPADRDLAIVRHELTHALVHEIVGPDATLPAWFDEGLATLEERRLRVDDDATRDTAITLTLLADGRGDLAALGSPAQWVTQNAALDGKAYTVAAEATRVLRERVTAEGLVRILEETGRGTAFATAYANVGGEALADFERAFPARLSSQYGQARIVVRPSAEGVRWSASGFAPGAAVTVAIEGAAYRVEYTATADRYGMYEAVFGGTAPSGEYAIRATGRGGRATASVRV